MSTEETVSTESVHPGMAAMGLGPEEPAAETDETVAVAEHQTEEPEAQDASDADADSNGDGEDSELSPEELKAQLADSNANRAKLYARLKQAEKVAGRVEQIEQILNQQQRAASAPKEEPVEVPDKDVDPSGYAAHMAEQTAKKVDQMAKSLEDKQTAEAQQDYLDSFDEWIDASIDAYAEQHADYDAAEERWTEVKAAELELTGATEEEIETALLVTKVRMAQWAKQKGTTLPEMIHKAAKTYGYEVPKPPDADGAEDDSEDDDAPAARRDPRLSKARAQKKNALSIGALSGGRGSKGGPAKSLKKQLAEMDQAQFNAAMKEIEDKYGPDVNLDNLDAM